MIYTVRWRIGAKGRGELIMPKAVRSLVSTGRFTLAYSSRRYNDTIRVGRKPETRDEGCHRNR
jgi:hypothetical protein